MGLSLISASNGSGEAVRANVTTARTAGSTAITVDALTNWPASFIATTGTLKSDNTLDPTTVQVFNGHINAGAIAIDSFAPGYTDKGNAVSDVVVLKPTTKWADNLEATLATSLNDDGSLKSGIITGTNIAANTINNNQIAVGGIAYANLLSTIFGGQVTQFTNTGAGSGTFYYVNLGGIKLLWGVSTNFQVGNNGVTHTAIALPNSFFSVINTVIPTLYLPGGTAQQFVYTESVSNSGIGLAVTQASGVTASAQIATIVVGS